ncbi:hypothetical protein [Bacillus sp. 1P02SD]
MATFEAKFLTFQSNLLVLRDITMAFMLNMANKRSNRLSSLGMQVVTSLR